MIRFHALVLIPALLLTATAALADAEQIGAYQSWTAYSGRSRGLEMCYVSARPTSVEGKVHSGIFAEVTDRPAEHQTGVIDITAGLAFKPGAPASLTLGGKTFTLFTHGNAAFAQDNDDPRIVAAMRAAPAMTFTGTDRKGNALKATFSLKGMAEAYQAIGKACHVETQSPARRAGGDRP